MVSIIMMLTAVTAGDFVREDWKTPLPNCLTNAAGATEVKG
jgi:hypothetical protein